MSIFAEINKIEKLSVSLKTLYLHRIIRDIGWGFVGMFGVIFIFVLSGKNLVITLIFYGAVSLLYFLFLPLAARLFKYVSLHKLMLISTLFFVFYLFGLYLLDKMNGWVWGVLAALVAFDVLNRLAYWVPYHVDLARFVDRHHRGRQITFLAAIVSAVGILLPIFSSFIIEEYGYAVLFVLAAVGILSSALPLFFLPPTREKYEFGYRESFQKLFNPRHFKINLGYFADGFQSAVGFYIWPVFIFLLFDGNYYSVGLVSAAILVATTILRFAVGEIVDRVDKEKVMKAGSVLHALGWVFKGLSVTGTHIFLSGTYHSLTNIFLRTPLDALTYEIAADEGHYIDEFSVLREMSLHIGKFYLALLAIVIYWLFGMLWVFVAGAIISLLIGLISKREFEEGKSHE